MLIIPQKWYVRGRKIGAVILFLLFNQIAFAGPCEDAQSYEAMAQQKARESYDTAMGGDPYSAFGPAGEAQNYRSMAIQSQARCHRGVTRAVIKKHPSPRAVAPHSNPRFTVKKPQNRWQLTGPKTKYYGNRGYGPERTGADWSPFLADLRPKAIASQIRQGDNYAKNGDWESAVKHYEIAQRIDPNNQRAREKVIEARQKLNQTQKTATTTPSQEDPNGILNKSKVLNNAGDTKGARSSAELATKVNSINQAVKNTFEKIQRQEQMNNTLDDKALNNLFDKSQ